MLDKLYSPLLPFLPSSFPPSLPPSLVLPRRLPRHGTGRDLGPTQRHPHAQQEEEQELHPFLPLVPLVLLACRWRWLVSVGSFSVQRRWDSLHLHAYSSVRPPSLPPPPSLLPPLAFFTYSFPPPSPSSARATSSSGVGRTSRPPPSHSLSLFYSTNLSLPPSLLPSLPLSPSTAPAASSLEVGKTNRPPPPYVGTWNVCCLWLVIAQSGAWGIHAKKEEEEEEQQQQQQQQQLFWTPRREGGREGGREAETSAAEFVSFPSGYGAIVVSC